MIAAAPSPLNFVIADIYSCDGRRSLLSLSVMGRRLRLSGSCVRNQCAADFPVLDADCLKAATVSNDLGEG